MAKLTLAFIAEQLNAQLVGDATALISAVGTLEEATSHQISFLSNSKYRKFLQSTQAGAVLIKADDLSYCPVNALVVNDPYVAFAKIAQLLDSTPAAAYGRGQNIVIDPSATVPDSVVIGPNVVISAGAVIGENVQIGAGTVIGQDSIIGSNSRLWANVTLYHNVHLGQDCIIHSGAVIGSDGFGYANERGQWVKIPQTGGVRIGDRVEIGANSTIDRGALGHTEIHNGVIIDNQVQVAHNDIIGENTAIAGSTTIAGSVTIGKYCIIGGNCAIAGHLSIADGVHISGATNITGNMREPGLYSSATVAMDNKTWRKNTVRFRQLDELFQRVKTLEKNLNTPE